MQGDAQRTQGEIVRLIRGRQWHAALQALAQALQIEPADSRLLLLRSQVLVALGRLREACDAAQAALQGAASDPIMLDAIGNVFSRANDQQRALAAFSQAVSLAPDRPQPIFNRAAVRRFLGDFPQAEVDYERVIQLNPADYEAYKNRSDLRTQTVEDNHIAQLEALLARPDPGGQRDVQLHFALAKEYEDLADYDSSFAHLQRGARARRDNLQYDVANDVATVDWIIEAFRDSNDLAAAGCALDAPIFIVGLPRSGSTLVERILASHSSLSAAGELNCLAVAIVDAVRRQGGPPPSSRRDLVVRSTTLDFAALGRDYLRAAHLSGAMGPRFTDKMPLNYLYCGLIRRALPNARIVHVTREPMAACYAMYKTLFADGYPFSYDLQELGRYYVAYRRLMDHWQSSVPGAIYSIRYESLVADQVEQTRALLQFCGLEWEEACAQFHRNPAATTTASASQVRQPIYASSVSQWRHYQRQLAPLSRYLAAAGIRGDD
jgi:tetratricopeptide (TPR) repeat protein